MMKTYCILLLTLVLCKVCTAQIPQYNVTMTPSDYELLNTRDIFSDSLLPAVFTYQSSSWNDAQIRFKGRSTRYYSKKSYRIRFNNTNLFQGMRQINFNSMYTDKSFLREKLAWDLFADMGALAPVAHHARFTINNDWKGLYLFVDKVDRYFLQKRGRIVAPMYEADDFYTMGDLTVQPDSLLRLYYSKEIGSSLDYSDLRSLIEAINYAPDATFARVVDSLFDMNSVYHWLAGNILMMMGDSYNKNYLLYRDTSRSTQQWVVIPWDYDLSFGRNGDNSIPYPASLLSDGFAYTFPPLSGPSNVLKDRLWNTPSLRERLRQKVDTLLQTVFIEERMHSRIDSLAALIQSDVALDPQKWGTFKDFLDHVDALKYYVTARRNYLIKTFINQPTGLYNDVTLQIIQLNVPHHFVAFDGRQIATMWFYDVQGLDSIQIQVYPGFDPPFVNDPASERFIKRWVRITPYPSNATFTAKLQWMYHDRKLTEREVGAGVQDERLLRSYYYDGSTWNVLPGSINPFANIVTIDSITQDHCGPTRHFALLMPETYTQTWFRQTNTFWQRWYDVKFVDAMNGFILGEHGTLLRTTDAGATWTEHQIGIHLPFHELAIPRLDKMFAVGEFGSLYRSPDTGMTWAKIDLGTTNNLLGVVFLTAQRGCVYGQPRLLKVTSDSGVSWPLSLSIDVERTIQHVAALNVRYGGVIVFMDSGYYLKTDLFSTYQTGSTGTANKINTAQTFGSNIWAAGDNGIVLYSPDEGASWNRIDVPSPITVHGIVVINSTTLYVSGDGGRIYYTTDNGSNWYAQYTADSHDLYAIAFTDSSHGYAVGNGGTILTTSTPGTVTGVEPILAHLPTEFQLFQNYPNPFNPVTHFRFSILDFGLVTLNVYDVLGREVATLVNETKQPGTYEVDWNASEIASGVYFYRLSAGDVVATRKAILIK
ncbi:MAG: CotH kinase family protein [Ignavibacteriae bacterium]|nr:CotH kinase family protein [Ignavibacteriota bacterium]